MKKKILAAVLASAMILSIAGCNQDTGNSDNTGSGAGTNAPSSGNAGGNATELKDDGDKLSILAWSNNSDIKNMVELFCEETGTDRSKIEIVAQGDSGGDASTQYQQYLSGDGDADLMCLEADWILKYINDDSLTAPLSALDLTKDSLANPYAYTVAIGTNEAGVLKGASFQAAPGGFAYRADLAEQYLGVKSPEEMQAKIKDWDSFQATAKELYEKSEGKVSMTATEGGLWQVYQANRTKPWVQDGKLVMDNAEAFYDIAKSMKDDKTLADVEQWKDPWYAAVNSGDCLGDFVSTWGLTTATTSILYQFADGKQGDDAYMAFCQGPSSYFWGGTWLGVSTKCDNKSLAKQFVEFFTCNDDTMKKYTEKTNDFCNNSKVMKDIVDAAANKNPLLKGGQDQFAILLDPASGVKMDGLITKYDSTIKEAFNKSVQEYIAGNIATKEEAIDSFKKTVAENVKDITVE